MISGHYFEDKETTSFSLSYAKGDDNFNALMMEKAYLLTNENTCYMASPNITKLDKSNIMAIKALNNINNKEGLIHAKARENLNQVIAGKYYGVTTDDINIDKWININPLTKALMFCIKDNHNESDINAIISERVIQYYQYATAEISSLDTDVEILTNAMLLTTFSFQYRIPLTDKLMGENIEPNESNKKQWRNAIYIP
ncbi:hypothetical protein [Yersinia aleksiciae]|nr:hypothetical protein [Yersinia aleksiciae]